MIRNVNVAFDKTEQPSVPYFLPDVFFADTLSTLAVGFCEKGRQERPKLWRRFDATRPFAFPDGDQSVTQSFQIVLLTFRFGETFRR